MKIRNISLCFSLLLLFIGSSTLTAHGADNERQKSQTSKTVRLVTVGNSFSGNATFYLSKIATAGGHQLVHKSVSVGGAPLQLHAEKALRHEEDPTDKFGLYGNGRSLKQELQAEPWNFVTIQQASIKSHDLTTYRPFAGQLRDIIKRYAPQAELLIHQTWEYRVDDPRFKTASSKPGEPSTQNAMYAGLTSSYETIAAELNARLIPVGDAFHAADNDPTWGYRPDAKFDFKSALFSTLPDQTHSLHVGWKKAKEQDGKFTLSMDGHHANTAGQYLGACVFYEVLFGESAVGNSFSPPGVEAEYVRFLQETAHDAVLKRQKLAKSNGQAK